MTVLARSASARQRIEALWRASSSLIDRAVDLVLGLPVVDLHTRVSFRAATDAVEPETPPLGTDPGPEHVPRGLAAGVGDFFVTYVEDGFQLGLPVVGPYGNLPLADPIAHALDLSALALIDTVDNESTPRDHGPLELLESGSFRENDYDTTGYEEPHPD